MVHSICKIAAKCSNFSLLSKIFDMLGHNRVCDFHVVLAQNLTFSDLKVEVSKLLIVNYVKEIHFCQLAPFFKVLVDGQCKIYQLVQRRAR